MKLNTLADKFRAALRDDGVLEIVIYETIGEDWWSGGGVTSKSVKAQLDSAGNYSRILVRINSPGGDAFEGIGIYNVLRAAKKPIDVCVDAIAASAASVIAMAGDTITMGPNCMMMIHNAWGMCMGEGAEMRKMADTLDAISVSIAQTYVSRTGKPLDEVTALMDAETWLTAQECVEQGFATNIVEEPDRSAAVAALAQARQFKALGRMKHVPAQLKADPPPPEATQKAPPPAPPTENPAAAASAAPPRADNGNGCACGCPGCKDGDCSTCDDPECDDPNCDGCPMQSESENALQADYAARMKLAERRASAVGAQ